MRKVSTQKITWYVFAWTISLVLIFFFISCENSIELSTFVDKHVTGKDSSSLLLQTVPYKHTNKIILTWKKVSNAASYFIYEFKNKTGTIASKLHPDYIAGPNTKRYTINISSNFTATRYFVVVARDKAKNVLFTSDMVEGKTLGKPILNESQIKKTFYSITFKWSPVEGVQKYTVQRKTKNNDYEVMHDPTHSEDRSWVFLDENVTPEDSYEYQIIAYVMNGEQVVTQSNYTFTVQVPKQESPSSVNNFVASQYVYSDRVLLLWNKPNDLDGFSSSDLRYSIYRREKNSQSPNTFFHLADTTSQELNGEKNVDLKVADIFKDISSPLIYEDTTAETNKTYEYKIIASYDTNKKPGKSSTIVEGAVIPKVRDVVMGRSSNGVVLRWSVPSDFKGVAEVHRSIDGLAFKSIQDSITESSYEDKGPHLPTKYTYKVRFVTPLDNIDKDKIEWNKGVFSVSVDYEHKEITSHDFRFSVSRNKKDLLLFTWSILKDISVSKEDFFIERAKSDNAKAFEIIDPTDLNISIDKKQYKGSTSQAALEELESINLWMPSIEIDVERYVGRATLNVNADTFKPTLYRLGWKSDGNVQYSKVIRGDVLHAPVGVTATKAEHAKYITVRWKPSNGAEKYKIQLKKHGNADASAPWTLYSFDTNDFILPQNDNRGMQEVRLTPSKNNDPKFRGIEYDIRVVAIGADEGSDKVESNIVQGSTFGPAGIGVRATKGFSKKEIVVFWDAHPHADEYLILRKTKGINQEFTLAKIPSESGKTSYVYYDEVDNSNYLTPEVPPLEKIYFQEYEYSVMPKKHGAKSSMSSVTGEGYLLSSPRPDTIQVSKGKYRDKIVVEWPHLDSKFDYVIYVYDVGERVYERTINVRDTLKTGEVIRFIHHSPKASIDSKLESGKFTKYEDPFLVVDVVFKRYYTVRSILSSMLDEGTMPPTDTRDTDIRDRSVGYTLYHHIRGESYQDMIKIRKDDHRRVVTGVQASDVDYKNDKGIYIAQHGASTHQYTSKSNISKINRKDGNSYATKITWDEFTGAEKYYIYRMDFNEVKNFWRKIGERRADETRVFFDTKSLILREYRSLYWVLAVIQDEDDVFRADESYLGGDPEHSPQNNPYIDTYYQKFDTSVQNEKIQEMSKNINMDVGSRWITPREYLNWSLGVIGEGVYELDHKTRGTPYGISRDSWSYVVNFTMNNYSLGAKARKLSNSDRRKELGNTELVINASGALSGTFTESCPKGDGYTDTGCYGATIFGRLGTYVGNGRVINIHSPYGEAYVRLSGTAKKNTFGTSVKVTNGVHYNFGEGSISFTWLNTKFKFSKKDNVGTKGPLNPYVTPIRFNRNYETFLKAVYGDRKR